MVLDVMTVRQFAKTFGLSTGTVSAKITAKVIVLVAGTKTRQGAQARIDVVRSVRKLLAEKAARQETAGAAEGWERVERLRMANAITRGDYIKAEGVRQRNMGACSALVQTLEALPQVCSSDREVQERIAAAILEARNAFADQLEKLAERDFDPDLIISPGDHPPAPEELNARPRAR